jgi:peptidoglycan/xylan/chitin deacetylase (PgdA/CDA1 family)
LRTKERASIERPESRLSLGPAAIYPVKATLTRGRSAWWLARTRGRIAPGLRMLFYHRVADDRDELAVAPSAFATQMRALAGAGLRAVDVVEAWRRRDERGLVGLSFDDAYLDVAEQAAPVLRELGFGATVFVATGVTAGRASFSWYDGRQPPLIPPDRLAALEADGTLRFEAHTVTHPNLLALEDAAARAEIVDSKRELEGWLGRPVTAFCYPAGLFGPRDERLVAEAGFELAVSCEPGVNDEATPPYALRRIQVDARDGLLDFRAKVGGGHDAPPPGRALYRRLRYGPSSRS